MVTFSHRFQTLAAVVIISLGGCATDQAVESEPTSAGEAAATASPSTGTPTATDPSTADNASGQPASLTSGGEIYEDGQFVQATAVRAAFLPLGSVPFDGFSLPLVSPDGVTIATQTGVPPDWDTVAGEYDAPVPSETLVELHQVTYGESPTVSLHTKLDGPLLLGRACDAAGVLVERHNEDNSRWIGRASWVTGAIDWLVRDDATNAFATIGPDGRLAWSRRSRDGEHYDLVVVGTDGRRWSIPAAGGDWLFPTWSTRGDGLFVLRLQGKNLDMVHVSASSPMAFRQSLRRFTISNVASRITAFQTMNGQPITIGVPMPRGEQLIFYYPTAGRAAIWRPRSRAAGSVLSLRRGSLTAIHDGPGHVLVPTPENLWRQRVPDLEKEALVLRGLLIPRRIAREDWPILALTPDEGGVSVIGLKMLIYDPLNP